MQADSDLRSTSRALTVFSKVIILATLAAQDCVQDLGPVFALVGVASQLHTLAGTCEPPPRDFFRSFTFLLDENGQLNYNVDITEPKAWI